MNVKRFRLSFALLFVIMFTVGSACRVSAQSNQGALAGSVLDSTGAVVVGATITAKNQATGQSATTVSSSAGDYRFPSLQVGEYTVTTTAPHFQQTTQPRRRRPDSDHSLSDDHTQRGL